MNNTKSSKQANFLHALKGDKAKGMMPSQALATPMAGGVIPKIPVSPSVAPAMMPPKPMAMTHMPQPAAPKLMPPGVPPMAPKMPMGSNVPALGGGAKLPKFAKTRNSLKSGPFKK